MLFIKIILKETVVHVLYLVKFYSTHTLYVVGLGLVVGGGGMNSLSPGGLTLLIFFFYAQLRKHVYFFNTPREAI